MKNYLNLIFILIFCFMNYFSNTLIDALCPMRCNCNDERLIAFCNNSLLDVVPITLNPELKELYLSNNQIKNIFSSFTVYRDLEVLDMTHNSMTSLGKKNFNLQNHLKVMSVSNNMITQINNLTFYGLSSLHVLNLNDNLLQDLPFRVFATLISLEKLDLSSNAINSVSPEAFSGLNNLKSLILRNNRLVRVPSVAFSHLPNLVKLDIGFNSFIEMPDYAFSSLMSLQELLLDSCSVTSIPETAFLHLSHLRQLNLRDNHLTQIPTEALENLKNLNELIISGNRVQIITAFAFRGLTNLKVLEMSYLSQLSYIDRDALIENVRLKKIVLEFNEKLKNVFIGTFDANSANLKYLSLRGNSMETLHSRLVQWQRLDFLDIRENPFNCNCSLVWFWKFLKESNLTTKEYLESVVCAKPPNLMSHPLMSIPVSDLGCYESKNSQYLTTTLIVFTVCTICCIFVGLWCRTRLTYLMHKKQYEQSLYPALTDDITYEKGRIIDNQVMCSPTTAIMIKPPIRIAPITEL
ncbi:leucine-rich repeat-containing G-protein coupled receptor 4-like [Oppia nitens]|uniref:leucine-rich repeat-containing G-protein coupled receptor 4-like n=1 Tax=Oppia nitens TaxID=1686743 RepID=UPI0023D9C2E1|nr:leucine-rich repeat-containing G-protein coupled receptor 4-like [Oppia nitens]